MSMRLTHLATLVALAALVGLIGSTGLPRATAGPPTSPVGDLKPAPPGPVKELPRQRPWAEIEIACDADRQHATYTFTVAAGSETWEGTAWARDQFTANRWIPDLNHPWSVPPNLTRTFEIRVPLEARNPNVYAGDYHSVWLTRPGGTWVKKGGWCPIYD